MERRTFIAGAAATAAGLALAGCSAGGHAEPGADSTAGSASSGQNAGTEASSASSSVQSRGSASEDTRPSVYFTCDISAAGLVAAYEALGFEATGKTAVKISTGEPGGHNFLQPKLIKRLVQQLDAIIVECCTAYGGDRGTSESGYPVALDRACVDLVHDASDGASLVRRIESRNGTHTLDHAAELGLGSLEYELVDIGT